MEKRGSKETKYKGERKNSVLVEQERSVRFGTLKENKEEQVCDDVPSDDDSEDNVVELESSNSEVTICVTSSHTPEGNKDSRRNSTAESTPPAQDVPKKKKR